ncbi:hypothetical protein WMY93_013402 [Mugilogobius chulae]|uniref:G-protein coupled receptors family 3 profile domain-containing protein n=1 Tax=Mugilogobius chulae TaxID=88201 RepID=A0AAW0NZU3_9GOBI
MSQGEEEYVRVVVTVLNSSHFEPEPSKGDVKPNIILDKAVLVVTAGVLHVSNLSEPVSQLIFLGPNGICVFWKEQMFQNQNPEITVDGENAVNLTYLSYIGSVFSAVCTLISFFIYACLHRRRPEKALGIHIQLAGAMLCLHQSFLVSSLFLWYYPDMGDGILCKV